MNGYTRLQRFLSNSEISACDPHMPWQKGSAENTNRLVRLYIPKKFSTSQRSPEYVQYVEDLINDRPRKSLD